MADPPLVVDDAEASSRVDGDFDGEADGGADRRPAVTRAACSAVACDEAESAAGLPEDPVGQVGDEQRSARLHGDIGGARQAQRRRPNEDRRDPVTARPQKPTPRRAEDGAEPVPAVS
jgi:hypothetical protein